MLIGSRALAHWVKDFRVKDGADWDFMGEISCEVPSGANIEVHPLEHLNDGLAVELFNEGGICSLVGLSLIKRSHLHRDWQWDKHITQYHKAILPNVRDNFYSYETDFLIERTNLTKKAYPQGNPSLNQSNEDFFDDAVAKVYDHDYLHELYAYGPRPMYENLKKPEGMESAWCEKDLWNNLPHTDKLKCVAEETYVIATERFMVPNQWKFPSKLAYFNALKKVCTTLTSGWFRDFAIDHYPRIVELYDNNRFENTKGILNV